MEVTYDIKYDIPYDPMRSTPFRWRSHTLQFVILHMIQMDIKDPYEADAIQKEVSYLKM